MSKAKTAMVFISLAIAMIFLLRTLYIRVTHSSTVSLVVAINIIIMFLFFHCRRNPDQLLHPQPLFSFPSLSRQNRYRPLVENNVDLPEPVVNVNEPEIVPPHLQPDVVSDIRSSDDVVWERGESSSRISSECQEQELSDFANNQANDHDDQGSNGTLDDMWNNIVATGKAKPVRLFTSNQREGNPKRETRKTTTTKRKERKKSTESTSQYSVERRTWDRSMDGATGISRDELADLSETFIKRHYNKLIIERQESDQRRIEERLGLRDYRNAVSV